MRLSPRWRWGRIRELAWVLRLSQSWSSSTVGLYDRIFLRPFSGVTLTSTHSIRLLEMEAPASFPQHRRSGHLLYKQRLGLVHETTSGRTSSTIACSPMLCAWRHHARRRRSRVRRAEQRTHVSRASFMGARRPRYQSRINYA